MDKRKIRVFEIKIKKNPEVAELLGIILGDGNIYINDKAGVYQIKIGLNSKNELNYARNFVMPLIERALNTKCSLQIAKKNEIFVNINRKTAILNIINLLDSDKRIPKWVWVNKQFLKPFIRGLVDTDGSVFSKTTNKSLPQIEFYQNNKPFIEDFRKALLFLGIRCSKVMNKKTKYCVGIYDKNQVDKYFNTISFNNLKNKERYLSIKASVV